VREGPISFKSRKSELKLRTLPEKPPPGYQYPVVQRPLSAKTLASVAEEMRSGAIKYTGFVSAMLESDMSGSEVPSLTEDELLSADPVVLRRFDGVLGVVGIFWPRAD
jgi:hypothetical protein